MVGDGIEVVVSSVQWTVEPRLLRPRFRLATDLLAIHVGVLSRSPAHLIRFGINLALPARLGKGRCRLVTVLHDLIRIIGNRRAKNFRRFGLRLVPQDIFQLF